MRSLTAGEPRWHRITRAVYIAMFILIWIEAVGCFGCFQILARGASPVATPELAAPVVNHGHVFYVAVWQKRIYDILLRTMMIGIPGIMASGFILHYGIGVKIFDNR
jgi:hypothetical protein